MKTMIAATLSLIAMTVSAGAAEQCLKVDRLDRWTQIDRTTLHLTDDRGRLFEATVNTGCRTDLPGRYPIIDSNVNWGCIDAGESFRINEGGLCVKELPVEAKAAE
jgi:hypothetical protein